MGSCDLSFQDCGQGQYSTLCVLFTSRSRSGLLFNPDRRRRQPPRRLFPTRPSLPINNHDASISTPQIPSDRTCTSTLVLFRLLGSVSPPLSTRARKFCFPPISSAPNQQDFGFRGYLSALFPCGYIQHPACDRVGRSSRPRHLKVSGDWTTTKSSSARTREGGGQFCHNGLTSRGEVVSNVITLRLNPVVRIRSSWLRSLSRRPGFTPDFRVD